jgi:hypothetical protein
MPPLMRTLVALLLLTAACSKAEPPAKTAEPAAAPAPKAAEQTYGKTTTGPVVTPAAILADIDGFAGKTVRVEGTIAAVCQKRGCWMEITGAGGESLRIKVKDGEVVFPMDAKGKKAIAEGTVVKIPVDPAADSTATCGGGEGEAAEGEHHDCSRPPGATARLDGVGATIIDS